ncbi:MAG: FHA domain-containing protein [bacterium]|nr:FHA domain-containing protein [bacterium]
MKKLQIYKKDELVREQELEKDSYSIGRDPHCDIPLEDNFISRRHARIQKSETGWVLEDLGSTNGTFIGKKRVTRQKLSGGEEIGMGPFRINFSADPPPCEPTRVATAGESTGKTEGRDKIPDKPVAVLDGKPGLLLLGPENLRRFFPLPEKPEDRVKLPEIPAEMVREGQNYLLRFPSGKNQPEMAIKPGWQNLPPEFSFRLIQPGEIVPIPPSAAAPARGKIRPSALLIPVLAVILLLLLVPAQTLRTWKGKIFRQGQDAVQTGNQNPPEFSPPAGSNPASPPAEPPLPANPRPETSSAETPLPAGKILPPPPLPRSVPVKPGPASRTPEVVFPSEPLGPQESGPSAPILPDRLARGFQAYFAGNLGQAREEWTSVARKIAPAEPDREKALRLARLAGQLRGELLLELEAEKQKILKSARLHFEEAQKLDGEISPGGKGRILPEARERLARFTSREGEEDLQQGDYPAAFLRFREALRLLPELAPARNGLALLAEKAQVLFREAYQLESANREEARGKYRLIMQMLPPEDEYYQKASRRLEAGP